MNDVLTEILEIAENETNRSDVEQRRVAHD
jgi:hypothetical protein